MKEEKRKQIKNILAVIKLLILIALIVCVPVFLFFRNPEFLEHFESLESVNAFLDQYQTASIFVYVGLQIIQITISFIPGQIIQFAAGYSFPFWLAYLLSITGIGIGTVVTYYLAKLLGRDAMHLFFGEERIHKFTEILNKKKAFIAIFVIFLIPGIPKDMFSYAAGLSEFKLRTFLTISLIARTPALMVTLLIGGMFRSGSYTGMIILAVIATILFILCIIFHKKIMDFANNWYDKTTKSN